MVDDKNKSNHAFADLMSSTKRINSDKVPPYRKKIQPVAAQKHADDKRVMEELLAEDDETSSFLSGDELTFLRDGYSKQILKKLRSGHYSIQKNLIYTDYLQTKPNNKCMHL